MNTLALRKLIALPILGLALAGAALAADTPTTPVENARIDDFAAGKKALDAKNWSEAASSFSKVVAKNPKNADAYNYLGYSNRWLENTTKPLPPMARRWRWTRNTRAHSSTRARPT